MMDKKEKLALGASVAATVIFGFSFLFSKICLRHVSPVTLLALRYTLAFAVCNLLLVTRRFRISLQGKPVSGLLLMGLLQPVIYAILELVGVDRSGAFFSGLMIALIPIASILSAALFLRETCTRLQIACSLLSVGGVVLTALGGETGAFSLSGFFCLLGAVVVAALYNILNRSTSANFSPFERIYIMFGMGMAVYLPAALVLRRENIPEAIFRPLANPELLAGLAFLGILSSVVAFFFMSFAATYLPVARTSVFGNVTTVISMLAGVLILRESVTWIQVTGAVVILVGVYGVNRRPKGSGEAGEP